MYTSDIKKVSKVPVKIAFTYLLVAIFCMLFGAIYEHFSHDVYSGYMVYAFAFPLVGGTLPFLTLSLLRLKKYPGVSARRLYHAGIATFTVGSIMQGILDIYGTTNSFMPIYWIAGSLFVFAGCFQYFVLTKS